MSREDTSTPTGDLGDVLDAADDLWMTVKAILPGAPRASSVHWNVLREVFSNYEVHRDAFEKDPEAAIAAYVRGRS